MSIQEQNTTRLSNQNTLHNSPKKAPDSTPQHDAKMRRRLFAARAGFFTGGFTVASWAPIIPFVQTELSLEPAVLGTLLFGLGIGSFFGMPIAGTVSTRFGNRAALAASGVLSCLLGLWLLGNAGASMAGIAVVVGHMFPVFSKFRGGKGVATSLGTSLVMNPVLGLILLAFSAVGIAITRVVSVFSLISIVAFAAINSFLCGGDGFEIAYSIALAVLVVFAHRSNIQRMVNGTEMNNRLDFSRRKTGSRNLK